VSEGLIPKARGIYPGGGRDTPEASDKARVGGVSGTDSSGA